MKLSTEQLAKMIDISCVRADVAMDELNRMLELIDKYHFICAFAMPCFTPWLAKALEGRKETRLGGAVGFPSGAESTQTKLHIAKEEIAVGCQELDMVINIGALKSGMYDTVYNDIKSIVDVAEGRIVKSILEVTYLTDYEIQKASELAAKAGVTFVKSGTGWSSKPTELRHIQLMKAAVGDSAAIKAAGGVRTLDQITSFIEAGCTRFGIGIKTLETLMPQLEQSLT